MPDIQILVGTNQLSSGGTFYRAKKTILHEKFDQPQFDEPESGQVQYANDIALIQTESPMTFNKKVFPLDYSDKEVEVGAENLQFTGWGVLNVSDLLLCCNLEQLFGKFLQRKRKKCSICRKKVIVRIICKY